MRKSVVTFGLVTAILIAGMVYWASRQDRPKPAPIVQSLPTDTIAHRWQWENFSKSQPAPKDAAIDSTASMSRGADEMPYDAVEVYKVLQGIRLDENGRLVPDATALQALERGYSEMGADLSPETMSELQELIRVGLPGPAGEEAAQILENYYRYRAAEAELNQLRAQSASTQMEPQLPTIDRYEEMVALRRTYLGQDVADGLFALEDVHARHMFASIALQQDSKLSAEEIQTRQEALQTELNERLLALGQVEPNEVAAEKVQRMRETGAASAEIYAAREALVGADRARELAAVDQEESQWQRRFNGFWQARRYVTQAAGLDPAERERQIDQLLEQYFSAEERDRARVTSVDWQAREQK